MLFNCKDLQKIWNNQINSVTLHLEIVCLPFVNQRKYSLVAKNINNKTYKKQTYSYINDEETA